ncbi:MAG TPA: peptidoglycan-associated lipoprotein Pal [candidate division Zixibacteria bacterium]|nr:peptidoglycan-associated lipoprotein Pal [candidate division Zixibacteria bacterium]
MALLIAAGCGPAANPPQPKWTVENPSASTGAKETRQAASREVKKEPSASSLDALRRGEAAAEGPLKDIHFAFDRYDLSPAARDILKANAAWLKANPSARVQIEGHCDERGTNEYNLALGAKRAEAAKNYLVSLGIAAGRLSTVSYGEEIPVCKEHNEGCWQKNRRARFVVTAGGPAT